MAKYKAKFTLMLTENEVRALRYFLGNMTGNDYSKAADDDEDIKRHVSDIYDALPVIEK